jgi:hypothetical protein
VSESECQTQLGFGLARNRRSPKRPSEPRPSGAHLEEDAVEKDGIAIHSNCNAGYRQSRWRKNETMPRECEGKLIGE